MSLCVCVCPRSWGIAAIAVQLLCHAVPSWLRFLWHHSCGSRPYTGLPNGTSRRNTGLVTIYSNYGVASTKNIRPDRRSDSYRPPDTHLTDCLRSFRGGCGCTLMRCQCPQSEDLPWALFCESKSRFLEGATWTHSTHTLHFQGF